jgi:hypothetical protein
MNLKPNKIPTEIFQRWIHSYEDDTQDTKVFHPSSYNFPLSRGRMGFEIKEDGTFIRYDIGQSDLPKKIIGKWKLEDDKIKMEFEDKELQSTDLSIISCDKNTLQIKK